MILALKLKIGQSTIYMNMHYQTIICATCTSLGWGKYEYLCLHVRLGFSLQ